MKKFYAFLAVALMSVSMFAAQPTKDDLTQYMKEGHYVACFSTPAESTCNDIVWIGTYNKWNSEDTEMLVCEPLPGFDGWYYVVVPVYFNDEKGEEENNGKPVQLSECGKFDWRYQCGLYGTITLVSGDVTISAGAGGKGPNQDQKETDLNGWSTEEPTIIEMTAWQESPCNVECNEHKYTIRLYDPFCEAHPEFQPYLRGTFNNWGDAVAMNMIEETIDGEPVAVWVYETAPITSLEFKWNNSTDKDNWDNQFEYFNEETGNWSQFENFKSVEGQYVYEYDYSDETKYRYAQCSAVELDTTEYEVAVTVIVPANIPEAGVEIVGTFDKWAGTAMTAGENNTYTATLMMSAATKFKIREVATDKAEEDKWDNQIVILSTDLEGKTVAKNMPDIIVNNIIIGDTDYAIAVWEEEEHSLNIDLSDATKYAWSKDVNTGLVNVEMLREKNVKKVLINGNLYIIRNNGVFNAMGTQVQ